MNRRNFIKTLAGAAVAAIPVKLTANKPAEIKASTDIPPAVTGKKESSGSFMVSFMGARDLNLGDYIRINSHSYIITGKTYTIGCDDVRIDIIERRR